METIRRDKETTVRWTADEHAALKAATHAEQKSMEALIREQIKRRIAELNVTKAIVTAEAAAATRCCSCDRSPITDHGSPITDHRSPVTMDTPPAAPPPSL